MIIAFKKAITLQLPQWIMKPRIVDVERTGILRESMGEGVCSKRVNRIIGFTYSREYKHFYVGKTVFDFEKILNWRK